MFCPSCRYEYRDGIETCPSCEVDLVILLPDLPKRERKPLLPYVALAAIFAVVLVCLFRTAATLDPWLISTGTTAMVVNVFLLLNRVALVAFFVFLILEWAPARSQQILIAAIAIIAFHTLIGLFAVRGMYLDVGIDPWPALTEYSQAQRLFARTIYTGGWLLGMIFYVAIGFGKHVLITPQVRAGALFAAVGMLVLVITQVLIEVTSAAGYSRFLVLLPVLLLGVFAEAYFFSRFLWPVTVEAEEPPVSATVAE